MSKILTIDPDNNVAVLTMNRPEKRNAMCDELLELIDAFFMSPPEDAKVVMLTGFAGMRPTHIPEIVSSTP